MKCTIVWLLVFCLGAGAMATASDWPVYMKDGHHSGVTDDEITTGTGPAWVFDPGVAPSPGFYPKSSEKNIGQQGRIVQATTFDYAYAPVIAGGRLYFGSSSQEAVFCLDAESGQKIWTFFAEGAVRFAPTVENGKVYFGSDDGYVYCLDAITGKLVWKFSAAPEERRIIANGRMASQWPVRTSLAIDKGTVYFSAGLFPSSGGVYLYALKADSGTLVWRKGSLSPSQGYLLAAEGVLFVPNGRASPTEFRQQDGSTFAQMFELRRSGGSAFVGMMDGMVMYGPTEFGVLHFRVEKDNEANEGKTSSLGGIRSAIMRGKIAGIKGWRAARKADTCFLLTDSQLLAMPAEPFRKSLQESADNFQERSKSNAFSVKSYVQVSGDSVAMKEMSGYAKWTAPLKEARSMIVAGHTVVAGANGVVKGYDMAGGAEKFSFAVDGTAWELAAAGGSLFVATDSGRIYCFGKKAKPSGEIKLVSENVFGDAAQAKFKAFAEFGIQKAGRTKGFCLIAGAGEGRLAYEVVKNSEFRVVCVERNPVAAAKARENLAKAGIYGRAVVHLQENGSLPYINYFANLVLLENPAGRREAGFRGEDLYKCLQPYGGVLVLDANSATADFPGISNWQKGKTGNVEMTFHVRGSLPEAGEWSHMFANARNSNCSGDKTVAGTEYLLQWFGDPMTMESAGWHFNSMSPLFKNGKLVNIKASSIECVDGYNGSSLWYQKLPDVTRLDPAREGGSGCLDDRNLYVAVTNDCQVFDLNTGKRINTFLGPDEKNDWGVIAVQGETLFGTKQNPKATLTGTKESKNDSIRLKQLWYADQADLVVSSSLFALNKNTGAILWTYSKPATAILNNSVTIGDKTVYLVECRNPKIADDDDGSVWLADFFAGNTFLIALDERTGKPVWETPFVSKARCMFYLSLSGSNLVETAVSLTGPFADKRFAGAGARELGNVDKQGVKDTLVRYDFRALDAGSGKTKWETGYVSSASIGHQHNYTISHPVITGTSLYNNPAEQYFVTVDLATGQLKEHKTLRRNKGCATPTGSEGAMFFRSMGIGAIDFASGQQFYLSDANRPSCWLNILPAGGLVLVPEYSFGCMCAFPLQTSVVFAPSKLAKPPELQRTGITITRVNEESSGKGKQKKSEDD